MTFLRLKLCSFVGSYSSGGRLATATTYSIITQTWLPAAPGFKTDASTTTPSLLGNKFPEAFRCTPMRRQLSSTDFGQDWAECCQIGGTLAETSRTRPTCGQHLTELGRLTCEVFPNIASESHLRGIIVEQTQSICADAGVAKSVF